MGADGVYFASGDGGLQHGRHRPGVLCGLGLIDAFLLRHPDVELFHGEAFLAAGPLQLALELLRELGGEVGRLVARQPLLEGLQGRADRLFGLFVAAKLREVADLGDELVVPDKDSFPDFSMLDENPRLSGKQTGIRLDFGQKFDTI